MDANCLRSSRCRRSAVEFAGAVQIGVLVNGNGRLPQASWRREEERRRMEWITKEVERKNRFLSKCTIRPCSVRWSTRLPQIVGLLRFWAPFFQLLINQPPLIFTLCAALLWKLIEIIYVFAGGLNGLTTWVQFNQTKWPTRNRSRELADWTNAQLRQQLKEEFDFTCGPISDKTRWLYIEKYKDFNKKSNRAGRSTRI